MTKFVIHRRVFVSMLFTALTLLGYISYRNLSVELLPSVELPFLFVQVGGFGEMDPQYVEKQAVIPLEGAIGTLEGIEKIESFANRRNGRIIVFYNSDINIKYAYLKLQEKIDAIKPSLPSEFIIQVVKIDIEQLSNMYMNLQVRGSGGTDRIRHIFENKIRSKLQSIDGIANVEVFGGSEKSLEIILNDEAARSHNVTPSKVRSLIVRNSRDKTFLGSVKQHQRRIFVNLIADFVDVNELESIVVNPRGPVLLRDVAAIHFDVKEETSISRVNGKEAVTVQLIHDGRVNLIELSHLTIETIDDLNKELKQQDIEIVIQQNNARYLEDNINLIINLALTGGLIALFILWTFLRNIRLVSVIALALPISVFTAFNLFYAFDITLNSLTLVGMALAVGMLLDNSIVVLENIFRHIQKKRSPREAVIEGTKEVWRSIFAATLTTTIVFLPFVFASNFIIRTIGYHISVSIISTLLVSLIVALTLIPMFAFFFFEKSGLKSFQPGSAAAGNRQLQIYMLLLKSAMRFPMRTVLWSVTLFFITIIIALAVTVNVQDEAETQDFNLYVTMPGGSTLETTDLAVGDLEERLSGIGEVEDLISQIYEEEAILTLKLVEDSKSINQRTVPEIKEIILEGIYSFSLAEVSFEQPQSSSRFQGGGRSGMSASFERLLGVGSQSEKITIKGRDFEIMRRVGDDIQYQLEELSSVRFSRLNVSRSRPEIHLLFDKDLLNSYNITLSAIAGELANFREEVSVGVLFKQDDEEYDILIRNENMEGITANDLKELPIPSSSGGYYPLEQVSRIIYAEGGSGINRVNQEKQIEVSYQFIDEVNESSTFLKAAQSEVEQVINGLEITSGVAIEIEDSETDLSDFYFLIGVAFILVYMVLAAVFESLVNPFVIMFTIPLAAIGSLWAIIFTENSLLNANTLIGFLILLGIVVNNGIILIDYTRILRKKLYRRSRALIIAGKARLRPILITAITTIVAMLPLAMGKVEYVTSIAAPFAITVIGGLSLSTLFTLVLIPTVYSGLESTLEWLYKLNWKIKAVQGLIFIAGVVLIYLKIESLIWQFANLFLIIILIPAITYFVLNSLRRAKSRLINPAEAISITIRNLYKIYDQPGRFRREWQKGERTSASEPHDHLAKNRLDIQGVLCNLFIVLFLFYFVYIYLQKAIWIVLLSLVIYAYVLFVIKKTGKVQAGFSDSTMIPPNKYRKLFSLFLWIFPLFNLSVFFIRWQDLIAVLFIGIVWYAALIVYTTSSRLSKNLVDINRLKGKFSTVRRRFYLLIQAVPVIGKKKQPFRALNGISLDIGKGMFGLLGPNGAGKTTLMRIICGILEQSYGSIHINQYDVKEYREELQGLIGYLPQDFGAYENMTAYEFINYQAILKNILDNKERENRVAYVLSAVHMDTHKDEKIASFSGGMKQRIGIAQTLLHLPRILVVDEPTAGLDPRERIRFRNLLVELSRERVVIFSTHIIEDIASSCDKVAVLNNGQIKYLGQPLQMVELAGGSVWQCVVQSTDFEEIRQAHHIVHHIKVGEKIRVRLLAKLKPMDGAITVKPTLEDSYLWLLTKQNGVKK